MKYILTSILLMTALVSQAKGISSIFSKVVFPFKWTITQIEYNTNGVDLIVDIENYDICGHTLSVDVIYAYSPYLNRRIKGNCSTIQSNKVIALGAKSHRSIKINFPNTFCNFFDITVFNLTIGSEKITDVFIPNKANSKKNIAPVKEVKFSDVIKSIQTWEEYYNSHKCAILTYRDLEEAKIAIQNDVEQWQKKGEFETTESWQRRVNDITRKRYISELSEKISQQHKSEINKIREEQNRLASEYEIYKKKILDEFYRIKILQATSRFTNYDFELKPYDADNETFLIHSHKYGDVLLPVPLDEAPSFKRNWEYIRPSIKPEFIPNGENVILSKLIFCNNYKEYVYDNNTSANYAVTDINYNFAPIEIAEIDFASVEIYNDVLTTHVSSSILGVKNTSKAISLNNVTPERIQVSASNKSSVDVSIPQNNQLKNTTTFAVIIANETYNNVSTVPFAENDGIILSKYLIHTVGLPKEHVKIYNNATFGNIAAALKYIDNLSHAFGEKLNLIIYYSGHGVPNEKTKRCMLLPVDGDATMPETCYDLDNLYASLGKYNANSIVVIVDACFSGSIRGDGMLFASRSVKIKASNTEPQGNMVIFSAAQGDETAFPFEKEQHGMFTYYLLKSLQENNGNVTLGQLSEYLTEQVKRQSVVSNGKLQTPIVQYSPQIENYWRSWKFAK